MPSLLRFWHLSDRLKTLAFALAGVGCFVSFKAGALPQNAPPVRTLAMEIGGYILAAAAVVLALEIGSRRRQQISN
jgi:hypothetical protein